MNPFAHMSILSSMIFLDICFMVGAMDAVRGDVLGEGSDCTFGSGVRVGVTHVDSGAFLPLMLRNGALDSYGSSWIINSSGVTPESTVVSKGDSRKYTSLYKFFPKSNGASSTPPPPRINL